MKRLISAIITIMRRMGIILVGSLLLTIPAFFSCDFPTGELIIKNATDYTVEITVTAHVHTGDEPGETVALKPGKEKHYEWDRTLTEVVVVAQAYEDYDGGKTIGRPSIRPVEITRGDDRVLTILWQDDQLAWQFKSIGGGVFE